MASRKNPAAVQLGPLGGGRTRPPRLRHQQRSETAQNGGTGMVEAPALGPRRAVLKRG